MTGGSDGSTDGDSVCRDLLWEEVGLMKDMYLCDHVLGKGFMDNWQLDVAEEGECGRSKKQKSCELPNVDLFIL